MVGHHGCGQIVIVVFGSGRCRRVVFMLWWSVVLLSMGGALPSAKYTFRIRWSPSVVVSHCPSWLASQRRPSGGPASWSWLSGRHGHVVVIAFPLQWSVVLLSIMGGDSGPRLLSIEVLLLVLVV